MAVYDGFADRDDMIREFREDLEGFPTDEEIIYAGYDTGDYAGEAFVLYRKDGKLFEVNASHCSCFGLEEQWSPEETSIEALKMRKSYGKIGAMILNAVELLEAR